jgi:hypothetical protein
VRELPPAMRISGGMGMFCIRHGLSLALIACTTSAAFAQPAQTPVTTSTTKTVQTTTSTPTTTTTTTTTHEKIVETGRAAGQIASQPVRDVGAQKIEIPAAVQKAAAAPYSLAGLRTCAQLSRAIFDLNDVLGPDFGSAPPRKENRAGKLAEAGGKTIVNTIIPFRGLVREISGAAPAERRLRAAIDASYARRGFLRGVALSRKCRA